MTGFKKRKDERRKVAQEEIMKKHNDEMKEMKRQRKAERQKKIDSIEGDQSDRVLV